MYQQILDALKTKFEGVSEAVLSRIAHKLAKTVTSAEQLTTAIEGVTIQQVIDSYADSRATEATQTAVQNYETKYGLKGGEKVKPTEGEGDKKQSQQKKQEGGDNVPAWAQALIDSNKQLTERLNQVETERTTNNRRTQLSSVVNKLPENLRKPYERIALDGMTDEQFTSMLTEITTEVDGIASDLKSKGAVFGRPTASGSGTKDELTDEQKKAIEHRTGNVAQDGQPF